MMSKKNDQNYLSCNGGTYDSQRICCLSSGFCT